MSLMVLGYQTLDTEVVERTFGCILKSADDIRRLREEGYEEGVNHNFAAEGQP